MNIRELLDKIDNIAVKESITMQDVQAAIAGKNNELCIASYNARLDYRPFADIYNYKPRL